jgi:hypothetical protein
VLNSPTKFRLTRLWTSFLTLSLVSGILLRMIFVDDMEYKEDEEYNFTQTQLIGNRVPWPWYGIPSGVYLVNPGMSIWVFAILAKIFRIHSPTDLAHAVQAFALLGMSLVIPFTLKWVRDDEKQDWFWAFALSMVNPFLVLYQRKLWPEPFLPFFTMLTLIGWWRKELRVAAFVWGLAGAWLGQVHMSGFFFSAALFLWSVLFLNKTDKNKTQWRFWFLGSVVGALPLIPWALHLLANPVRQSMTSGLGEILQFKYWVFWITDPLGLHLGNPLGLLRGQGSNFEQISDFVRYPLIGGRPTYLVGLAHVTTFLAALFIGVRALRHWYLDKKPNHSPRSATSFLIMSAMIGCGLLMTTTGVVIRRYYMTVTFPLEFLFWIRLARSNTRLGTYLLAILWISEAFISGSFVHYIHVNQGSIWGDYGKAYHLVIKDQVTAAPTIQNH